jgi:hypothetical protein
MIISWTETGALCAAHRAGSGWQRPHALTETLAHTLALAQTNANAVRRSSG